MKKSEMYRMSQMAVLRDPTIRGEDTLEILKELMAAETLARYCEEQDAEQEEEEL